jgi:hypothetical protein
MPDIVATTASDVHPPLYYLVCRVFYLLFPEETSIRAVSLVFGGLSLPLIFAIGRILGGVRVGLFVLTLLVFHPFHIHYSIEGRNYMTGIFFASLYLLGATLFITAEEADRKAIRWGSALYFLGALLAVYTHNLLVLAVFATGSATILTYAARRRWRMMFWSAALNIGVAVCYIPWMFVTLQQAVDMKEALNWMAHPFASGLWEIFYHFLLTGSHQSADIIVFSPVQILMLLLLGGVSLALWSRRKGIGIRAATIVIFISLLLPLMLEFVISHYKVRIFYPGRYSILQLPPYMLLIALAIESLRWRWIRLTIFGLLMSCYVYSYVGFINMPLYSEMRNTMQIARLVLRPNENLYIGSSDSWIFQEYHHYAPILIPPHKVEPLLHLFNRAKHAPPGLLPNRVLLSHWGVLHQSSKTGLLSEKYLKEFSGKRQRVYSPDYSEEFSRLYLYDEIDWEAIQQKLNSSYAEWQDLPELPWIFAADAGAAQFQETQGFAEPHLDERGITRWMIDGNSWFTSRLEAPLPPGIYWFTSAIWRHTATADQHYPLTITFEDQHVFDYDPPVDWSLLFFPFYVTPEQEMQYLHLKLKYDTWVPKEKGISDQDERKLGFLQSWYGVMPSKTMRPDHFVYKSAQRWDDFANLPEFEDEHTTTGARFLAESGVLELDLNTRSEDFQPDNQRYDVSVRVLFRHDQPDTKHTSYEGVWEDRLWIGLEEGREAIVYPPLIEEKDGSATARPEKSYSNASRHVLYIPAALQPGDEKLLLHWQTNRPTNWIIQDVQLFPTFPSFNQTRLLPNNMNWLQTPNTETPHLSNPDS